MKNNLLLILLVFIWLACDKKKQTVLYELQPNETVAMQDEHFLAVFANQTGYYLFTHRGTDTTFHFIFNGKDMGNFDKIFRCLPPDIIFFKSEKRYRFDPFRAKLIGPYDYFDGMGVDQVEVGEHLAVVGIRGKQRFAIIDGQQVFSDTTDAFSNWTLYNNLFFGPENTWVYLTERKQDTTKGFDAAGGKFSYPRSLASPLSESERGNRQFSANNIVTYGRERSPKVFLNDKFLLSVKGRDVCAASNEENVLVKWTSSVKKDSSESTQVNPDGSQIHPVQTEYVAVDSIWANGLRFGRFGHVSGIKVGRKKGSFAFIDNFSEELIKDGKRTGIKQVKSFAFDPSTGSTLAITKDNHAFFNNSDLGPFQFPVTYSYSYSTSDSGLEVKDSTALIASQIGFVENGECFYFSILKNGKEYFHLWNGKEIAVEKRPVFSAKCDIAYQNGSQIIINDKPVSEGFSLIYDNKQRAYKWLSLNGNKILLNEYTP